MSFPSNGSRPHNTVRAWDRGLSSPCASSASAPVEIIALFARERLPAASGERLPRSARADTAESLLPPGMDAVLRASGTDEVVLVGMGDRMLGR
jgi:hypothetical protein